MKALLGGRPILEALWRKRYVIVLGAMIGGIAGSAIESAYQRVRPWHESDVAISFENRYALPAVANVLLTSVDRIVNEPEFVDELERAAGGPVAFVTTGEGVSRVRLRVQTRDPGTAQTLARMAADQVVAVWALNETAVIRGEIADVVKRFAPDLEQIASEASPAAEQIYHRGLDTGRSQGRVDSQVTSRVPDPIVRAAGKWYDKPVEVIGEPSPVRALPPRRFVGAGFFVGLGLAIAVLGALWQLAELRRQLKVVSAQ